MKNFPTRVAIALTTGYVLFYFGEAIFWATPDRPGMGIAELTITWLVYSVFAYVFLCVVSLFKVRSVWSVFLAGAFFGWYEEGIIMATTFGTPDTPFPMSISFTGLAWHALIDVLVGWYLVRRVLAQNRISRILAVASAVGVFYGLWAIFWWTEPPEPMKALFDSGRKDLVFLHFTVYSLLTAALFVVALGLYQRVSPVGFKPTKIELWILALVTLLYFGCVTVPTAPKSLVVLPLLMGVTLWALSSNRQIETRADAIVAFDAKVRLRSYLCLLAIPLVAIAIYFVALVCNAFLRTNLPIYYLASAAGALMWITSIVMVFRSRRARISSAQLPSNPSA